VYNQGVMTPLTEWLKPPRTLLLILFLLALVSVSALVWFGWKLFEQERIVETQRSQEGLEQAADRIAATLRGSLAETGERLGSWETGTLSGNPPPEGLLLRFTDGRLTATPANRLLYYPVPSPEPEAGSAVFAAFELLEFAQGRPAEALQSYERLASSNNAAIRAGALLRTARVLRSTGRKEESRAAYARLAACTGVRVADAPADLVARQALCELSGQRADAEALRNDLLHGRWYLSRGQFEFYWSEATRLSGRQESASRDAVALSEAAAQAWNERKINSGSRGQHTVWIGGQPFFLMWRGDPERRAVLVAKPEFFLKQIVAGAGMRGAVVDAEGRVVAGNRTGSGRAAVRTAAETQLPWTLYVSAADRPNATGLNAQQRYLLFGTSVMVLFLILGTYFIAGAIRRESETSRMQADFVSAVSHEFRSPLTSMRQLSEILAEGRVFSEDRRQLYYETLVRETTRLQRLIEGLLNFGRMDARARHFRFEELDAALLVQRVVSEFETQMTGTGRRIELSGSESPCLIDADAEAISVALRNLLDNAIKYSPDCPTVWVEWGVHRDRLAIQVRDKGSGIAHSERKAIFRKFVRGTAATATNAKGSGVGLAMVRHIVAAHGGEITVASEPGQGSAFTMLLPLVERS
jgi:signal transduction histidine kinase